MYARIRARWGRRPAIAALAAAVVLVLGACETQPATDVTHNAATLNGLGQCHKGLKGYWRYQLRDATAGGSFFGVGPQNSFDCGADTGVAPLPSHRVGGLTPGRLYQFRIRTDPVGGQPFWQDSRGTVDGTAYDSFRTFVPQVVYDSSNFWPNDESDDPGIPNPNGDETAAEASAVKRCKGRFKPLENMKHYGVAIYAPGLIYADKLYEAGNLSKWCWYSGGRIYYRDHWHINRVVSRVDGVTLEQSRYSSGCFARSCLYRSELHASVGLNLPGDLPDLAKQNYHCIGTRIYAGGIGPNGWYHNRNIEDDNCSDVVASARRSGDADGDAVEVEIGGVTVAPAT